MRRSLSDLLAELVEGSCAVYIVERRRKVGARDPGEYGERDVPVRNEWRGRLGGLHFIH